MPFHEEQLQPASYDLLLGDIETQEFYSNEYWLENGVFILACTIEWVNLPNNIVGRIEGKSSLARKGIIVHTTAGFVDPGFKGQLTLELSNLGKKPFLLKRYMPIAQIAFMKMDRPANRPYGSQGLDSHYQGQTGPTPSYL